VSLICDLESGTTQTIPGLSKPSYNYQARDVDYDSRFMSVEDVSLHKTCMRLVCSLSSIRLDSGIMTVHIRDVHSSIATSLVCPASELCHLSILLKSRTAAYYVTKLLYCC